MNHRKVLRAVLLPGLAVLCLVASVAAQTAPPFGYHGGIDEDYRTWGWAYDPDSPDKSLKIHLYMDGENAASGGVCFAVIDANIYKQDVNIAYNITGNHGFEYTIPMSILDTLSPGEHTVYAYAIDYERIIGNNSLLQLSPHTFTVNPPIGYHEPFDDNYKTTGWAFDPDASDESIYVRFYLDGPAGSGQLLATEAADIYRSGVNTTYGITGSHAFEYTIPANVIETLSPGEHQVYAYALDNEGVPSNNALLTWSPQEFTITVPDTPPFGYHGGIDENYRTWGWAYDPDSPDKSLEIHLYMDGPPGIGTMFAGIPADIFKNDVNIAYNITGNHGFEYTIPASIMDTLSPGEHEVYAYAIDYQEIPGNNALLELSPHTFTIVVPDNPPFGYHGGIDEDYMNWGWAYDPDSPDKSLEIHLYMDGANVASGGVCFAQFTADIYRRDVNREHGITGNHGFEYTIPASIMDTLSAGEHEVYAYAIDYEGVAGNNALLELSPHTFTIIVPDNTPPVGYHGGIDEDYMNWGWAYDPDSPDKSLWIHFYLDGPASGEGEYFGAVAADIFRNDVNKEYNISGNHGFEYTIPDSILENLSSGNHQVYAYAWDYEQVPGNNSLLELSPHEFTIVVPDTPPFGYHGGLDEDYMNWGWAYDPDSPDKSLGIHFYLDGPVGGGGEYCGAVAANIFRNDVNKEYNISGNHGFEYTIPDSTLNTLSAGVHEVYAYAIDYEGMPGNNALLELSPHTFTIVVPDTPPFGYHGGIDEDYMTWGWAYDPDSPDKSLWIHLYMDGPAGGGGEYFGAVAANIFRNDVNKEYNISGNHGFEYTIPDSILENLCTGNHQVYAYAWDYEQVPGNNSLLEMSPRVFSIVTPNDVPPTVTILSPSNGAIVGGTVTITVDAQDDCSIEKVEFFVDGDFVGSDASSPYVCNWDTWDDGNGNHTITATAYDFALNESSTSISVTVDNSVADNTPPNVSLTSPSAGAILSGWVTVSANASDASAVSRVEFWIDGSCPKTIYGDSGPYVYEWNTGITDDGPHTVKAVAYDVFGNWSDASVSVTVDNSGGTGDVTAPSVAISQPASGVLVSEYVGITATASDASGIAKVEFYIDGTYMDSDNSSPYTYLWNSLPYGNGEHIIMAKAFDNAGNTNSASITVTVFNTVTDITPPTVDLTYPTLGLYLSGLVTVTATASDNQTNVHRVEFFVGGVKKHTDYDTPYSYDWNTFEDANGYYTVAAKAYDNAGNSAEESVGVNVLNVSDNTPPQITIVSPPQGATVSALDTVKAAVSDANGINIVEFFVDNTWKHTDTISSSSSATDTATFIWNTVQESDANHTVKAKAHDNYGNTDSASVTVTVHNINDINPPTVNITSPTSGANISSSIEVRVNATDNTGVDRVDYYIDGEFRGSDDESPYIWLWEAAHDGIGPHTIRATAFDLDGNEASHSVSVTCSSDIATPTDYLTYLLGDVIHDIQILDGGASGFQVVQYVDVSQIGNVPVRDTDPYWWWYYRSFFDSYGVHIGTKAETYTVIDDWYRENYDQTVGLQSSGYPITDMDSYAFANATFYDTRVMDTYADNFGTEYMGWIHHYRRRIEGIEFPDHIPGWSTLGPNYYQYDVPMSGMTFDFRIELGNYVWWIDNGYGGYNPGYWETIIAGEVSKEGWACIPLNGDPVGLEWSQSDQWLWIVPEEYSVSVGVPPNPRFLSHDPVIVDPDLWLAYWQDAEHEAIMRANEAAQRDREASFGGVLTPEVDKEGTYVYIDVFGNAREIIEDQAVVLAQNDKKALVFMNGSGNSFESAISGAKLLGAKMESPVILVYQACGIDDYATDNSSAARYAFSDLLQALDRWSVKYDVVSHSWSGHLVGNVLKSRTFTGIQHHWAINPAHGTYQDANDDWETYLQYTNVPTTILHGTNDPVTSLGLGSCTNNGLTDNVCDIVELSYNYVNQIDIAWAGHTLGSMFKRGMKDKIDLYRVPKLVSLTEVDEQLPEEFSLSQNYPNPFNPTTSIEFSLPENATVRLDVFNILGQQVATLLDEEMPAGYHVVQWDGRTDSRQQVSSGVYFYRIQAEEFIESKKMLLLK